MVLVVILLLPASAFVWALWSKFNAPVPPGSLLLGATGSGALVTNLGCAFMLSPYEDHGGSLTKAAFLSARNDAMANVAIIGASLVTAVYPSVWPDVVVGFGIACMNIDAAKQVWTVARAEHEAMSNAE